MEQEKMEPLHLLALKRPALTMEAVAKIWAKPVQKKSDRKHKQWLIVLLVSVEKGVHEWKLLTRLLHTDTKKLKPSHLWTPEELKEYSEIVTTLIDPVGDQRLPDKEHTYFREVTKTLSKAEISLVYSPVIAKRHETNGATS